MTTTGLVVFDKTLQTTNIWLDEIMEVVGPDRQVAWQVLGVVLRTLRDRLPLEMAAHVSAQLPLLIRGAYYDQWKPRAAPEKIRSVSDFLSRVEQGLSTTRPVNARDAVKVVFQVMSRHIDQGQIVKVRQALPSELLELWPEESAAQRA